MTENEKLLFKHLQGIQKTDNLKELLQRVSQIICRLLNVTECALFMDNPDCGFTALVVSDGIDSPTDEDVVRIPLGPWCLGKDPVPRRWEDLAVELKDAPVGLREGSFWVPFLKDGQPMGRIAVVPPAEDEKFLENFLDCAEFVGCVIGSHRTCRTLSDQRDVLVDLFEVGQVISSTLVPEQVLKKIVENVTRLVAANSCSVMLLDDEKQTLYMKMSFGIPDEIAKTASKKIGVGISGKVALTGKPLFVRSLEHSKGVDCVGSSRYKTSSFISVPLKARGKIIGVLNVSDRKDGLAFTPEDFNIISLFATQAEIAIDNANLHAKLWKKSVTDELTDTFVHSYLMRQLQSRMANVGSIAKVGSIKDRTAVIMIDLDFFKRINDTYGHLVGDDALVAAAKFIRKTVRSDDIVARYGGDEFAVVLGNVSPGQVYQIAQRLRKGIEDIRFDRLSEFRMSASFGAAMAPEDGSDAELLIQKADSCLYESKARGRNCVTVSGNFRLLFETEKDPDNLSLSVLNNACLA